MRLGTTIAAVILVGSLNASTAEDGSLTTPPPPTVPPAIGPPAAALEPAARAAVATLATSTEDRTAATPGRRPGSRPTLTINLSAGEGAGVAMVAGAAQLDPAGVFLAPIEDPTSPAAAGTGSTGADLGSSSTTEPTITAGAPPGAEPVDPPATIPVPTGLLTLPAQRLATPTQRVDSVVAGAIPPGSTVTVDIRGRDANGTWTEWIPSTDASGSTVTLPRTSVEVQSRLVLTGPPAPISGDALPGPTVRAITLIVYPIMLPAMPAPTVAPTSSPTTSSPTTTPPASVPTTTPRPTSTTSSRTSSTSTSTTTPTASRSTTSTSPTSAPPTSRTSGTTTSATSSRSTTTAPSSTATTTRSTTPASTTTTTTRTTTTTPSPTATPPAPGSAQRHRVFATREGLVGRTTANGHKIKSSDRFVALPSRRALSPNGSHDYSVRVCAANGRCAVAPVWDVGPWNTRDDYWNPPSKRQEWRDLPQGMPEAQAANQKGYNGGKDQFGRRVANPAGIDLSDGLFWDALGLKDNSWVTVDYLWTGSSSNRVATSATSAGAGSATDSG